MNVVKTAEYKPGKRVQGHYWTLDTGEVIYVARRKHRHIFRAGRISISGAMDDGEAAWAIDERHLFTLRAKGIKRLGVQVEDTGDFYLANVADFFDHKKSALRDYTGVGRGERQRYLRLQHFECAKARVNLPGVDLDD